jgi:hypothetical protein
LVTSPSAGLDIPSIKNGLIGLSMEPVSVYIQLWEHREEGKFDMVCGYQGQTKNLGFRNWLRDIDRHNLTDQPTNAVQQRFKAAQARKLLSVSTMRQILGKVARRSRKEREQQKKVDPFERVRLKKLRSAERRAERKRLNG